MRIFNRYIISLVLVGAAINIILALMKQEDLTVYFTVNTIAYLVITLLNIYLSPRASRALNGVALVLFSGFMVIVLVKAADIVMRK